jgi:hypothetical protein
VLSDHRFFPTVLIALDVCAAARYAFCDGEWRRVIYWLAAAILTATVTW